MSCTNFIRWVLKLLEILSNLQWRRRRRCRAAASAIAIHIAARADNIAQLMELCCMFVTFCSACWILNLYRLCVWWFTDRLYAGGTPKRLHNVVAVAFSTILQRHTSEFVFLEMLNWDTLQKLLIIQISSHKHTELLRMTNKKHADIFRSNTSPPDSTLESTYTDRKSTTTFHSTTAY